MSDDAGCRIERRRLDRRTLLGAGAASALALWLAACTSERQEGGPGPGPPGPLEPVSGPITSVAMVGDSLTVGAEPALRAGLEALGLTVTIDAEVGRRIAVEGTVSSGLEAVADVLAAGPAPDLWIVALGTNDIQLYPNDAGYGDIVNELLAEIGPDPAVLWVNTYTEPSEGRWEDFNGVVATAMAGRLDGGVVDWADVAESDDVLSGDGVHPTDEGSQRFADEVVAVVAMAAG